MHSKSHFLIVVFRFYFSAAPLHQWTWPGGVRGAIESAALAVGMARRVGLKAQKSECQSQSADHKPPSYLPPAHLRIPPGHPKPTIHLIFWFCKNNSQCRAGSKTLIDAGSCYEFASKMQASNCFFYAFHVSTHFMHHFYQKCCSCSSGGHIFAKRLQAILIKKFIFLTPKRPR